MNHNSILLFADRLPPQAGGMEVHAYYFIEHFKDHPRFPLTGIVCEELGEIAGHHQPTILFFNSGRWIEQMDRLRARFPQAHFVFRTGGNEIIKAPLTHLDEPNHCRRQQYWVAVLNRTVDLLLTNSTYTNQRLREIGITCPLKQCVGGAKRAPRPPLRLFCAARYVPYKNHKLLLSVVRLLVDRRISLKLRLAGEGPLLQDLLTQVESQHLQQHVEFLGVLSNSEVTEEIANSDVYIQLSSDHLTEVPGGSYLHSEGMGRAILEAIAAGTFVIAGNSGALPEIVTRNRGVLVELGTASDVADQVEAALPNRGCDDYSWERLFTQYEQLLEAIH